MIKIINRKFAGIISMCSFCICQLASTAFANNDKAYFQQQVEYKISVTLDDKKHQLSGDAEMKYINHSPDILTEIYFHLWPNAYKDRTSALCKQLVSEGNIQLYFAPDSLRGFMDELDFKVNNKPVTVVYDSLNADICRLILNQPLKPEDSITITTPFRVKIPDAKFSRLGHIGDSYMISQWYPKPAVYDKFGWHPMPYLSQGEFYSEYGSFDVRITLPENYVVAASGYLQTPSEIEFIKNKIAESSSVATYSSDNSFPISSDKFKTIQFVIDSVHDFAWFADKRFHISHKTIQLPQSGKQVECYAYFTNSQPYLWLKAASEVADAVRFYSEKVGEYPYGICTAVDGTLAAGVGMEYPTITVIGNSTSEADLCESITHEVGHNWFYGILGSNERDHAWMDEGINSFYEISLRDFKYKDKNYIRDYLQLPEWMIKKAGVENLKPFDLNNLFYQLLARQNNDQPGDLSSSCYTTLNYGAVVYSKTAVNFYSLKKYLGDSLFDSCMQQYFSEWKFKHPYSDDIRQVFEKVSGKSLNWFFKGVITSKDKSDFKIVDVKKMSNGYSLRLKNSGQLSVPVSISAYHNNQFLKSVWVEPFSNKTDVTFTTDDADYFLADSPDYSFDYYPLNNFSRSRGIFRRFNKVEFSFLSKYENPLSTQLFYLPAIGYNSYNGLMAGVILHNISALKKKFEFSLMPMYGFKSRTPAGTAMFNYSILLNKTFFDRIDVTANPRYFRADRQYLNSRNEFYNQDYFSLPVHIKFRVARADCKPDVEYSFRVSNILNHIRQYEYKPDHLYWQRRMYQQVALLRNSYSPTDPSTVEWMTERGEGYIKSQISVDKEFTLTKRKKDLYLRFFAGTFLYKNNYDGEANFTSSAWMGRDDYLMQEFFSGRNDGSGFWSHQMVMRAGGMKAYYPVKTNHWMFGINTSVKTPLPGIRVFADLISFYKASAVTPGTSSVRYDAGICLSIFKDAVEVYLPLVISKEIKTYYDLNDYKYTDRIRFVFDLHKLNPVRLRDLYSR